MRRKNYSKWTQSYRELIKKLDSEIDASVGFELLIPTLINVAQIHGLEVEKIISRNISK
jgi:hypothetical protein